ncbi:MAG: hypothetical protein QM791_23175 [Ferruginibacter sp.]
MKMLFVYCLLPALLFAQPKKKPGYRGIVKFVFTNSINGNPVVLHDSSYTNTWNESYTLSKLKYYISNISVCYKKRAYKPRTNYYLINQADSNSLSFTLSLPVNEYDSIRFLPGVDSLRNCSGAQTGALDPLNDMFWTWSSGYVMQKIEGNSPQSNFVNNKFEYHIGGYKEAESVLRFLTLAFPAGKTLHVNKGKTTIVKIEADLDLLWKSNIPLRISETAVCTSPGVLAKNIAANFAAVFSVADIINPD